MDIPVALQVCLVSALHALQVVWKCTSVQIPVLLYNYRKGTAS